MKVGWYLIGDENTPSSRIMGYNVSKWMNENEITSDILTDFFTAENYDTLIFQKIYTAHYYDLAKAMQQKGKQIIYIIDDLYAGGIQMAQLADKVICGSDYIKDWLSQYTKDKFFVIDDAYETDTATCKQFYNTIGKVQVVWFGTLLHFKQAEDLRPLIERLGYEYTTITLHPRATKQWSLETIWHDVMVSDIVVIPYLGELPPYELAKGNNRLTQSMVLGMPVITSPIPAYLTIIQQGKNGFITYNNDEKDWEIYLSFLKDEKLRQRVGKAARESVIEKYHINTIGNRWKEILSC